MGDGAIDSVTGFYPGLAGGDWGDVGAAEGVLSECGVDVSCSSTILIAASRPAFEAV